MLKSKITKIKDVFVDTSSIEQKPHIPKANKRFSDEENRNYNEQF